jgi:hypothetical protein
MLNQVLQSPIWQTVAALILIVATATGIITSIQKGPSPPRQKKLLSITTGSLTILLIVGTSVVIHVLSPTNHDLTSNPTITATSTGAPLSPTSSSTGTPNTGSASANKTPITTSYLATDPGTGCDTGGGTWDAEGFSLPFTCETKISEDASSKRGYLYFSLPNSEAFSSKNRIGVTGKFIEYGQHCVGLAEENASTGYLGEYCNDGGWFIYSISSAGAILGTLKKGITAASPDGNVIFSQDIAMTLQGTTLSFSIGAGETHSITISPIQPSKVAITFYCRAQAGFDPASIQVNNFSYTAQ